MDSFAEEFKRYCADLRKKERAKCAHLSAEPVKLPRFDILKYERNLETGDVKISIVGFNLSLKEAETFQKACHSKSIRVGDELIFTKWFEVKSKED
jgi:hypothetical protein